MRHQSEDSARRVADTGDAVRRAARVPRVLGVGAFGADVAERELARGAHASANRLVLRDEASLAVRGGAVEDLALRALGRGEQSRADEDLEAVADPEDERSVRDHPAQFGRHATPHLDAEDDARRDVVAVAEA